jgi:outer membrane biogenesis lipoprotein LolB
MSSRATTYEIKFFGLLVLFSAMASLTACSANSPAQVTADQIKPAEQQEQIQKMKAQDLPGGRWN